jgi:hypothetical protein
VDHESLLMIVALVTVCMLVTVTFVVTRAPRPSDWRLRYSSSPHLSSPSP